MKVKRIEELSSEQKDIITAHTKEFSYNGKKYCIEAISSIDAFNRVGPQIYATIGVWNLHNKELVYHEVYTTMLSPKQLAEACETLSNAANLYIKEPLAN